MNDRRNISKIQALVNFAHMNVYSVYIPSK
jgi:hypothetical protein